MRFSLLFILLTSCSCATLNPQQRIETILSATEEEQGEACLMKEPPADNKLVEKKEVIDVSKPVMLEVNGINGRHVDALIKKMDELKAKGAKQLWLKINSGGGSVDDGYRLIQAVESFGSPVTCVVDVEAQSMAFILLESCDKRLMTGRSILMAHEPWLRMQGNSTTLKDMASYLEALHEGFIQTCLLKMNITREELIEKTKNKIWYLSSVDALKYKAVDAIITPKELPKQTVKLDQKQELLFFQL